MNEKKQNPKHSVDKGAQREKYNTDNEESYVKDPKDSKDKDRTEKNGYLEGKWKAISSDFRSKYNIDITDSEYKNNSFSEIAEKLENQTGKSRSEIEREIESWKNS